MIALFVIALAAGMLTPNKTPDAGARTVALTAEDIKFRQEWEAKSKAGRAAPAAAPAAAPTPAPTCKEHVALTSAAVWAKELGQSEGWVLANHRVNVWANPSPTKFPVVGKLIPGSRAVILEKSADEYKIQSPLDKSVGWISANQVERTRWQDVRTNERCEP